MTDGVDQGQLELARLTAAYQSTFSSVSGQEVLRHLVSISVTVPSHVPGDPYTTAFNEGRRHLVLSILRQLNRDVFEMIQAQRTGGTNENAHGLMGSRGR